MKKRVGIILLCLMLCICVVASAENSFLVIPTENYVAIPQAVKLLQKYKLADYVNGVPTCPSSIVFPDGVTSPLELRECSIEDYMNLCTLILAAGEFEIGVYYEKKINEYPSYYTPLANDGNGMCIFITHFGHETDKITTIEQLQEALGVSGTNPSTDDPSEPPPEDTTATIGGLKYKLSGKNAAITGAKDKNAKSLKIPATIKVNGKSYQVTAINAKAFSGMKKLTKVEIGKNVKDIGKAAFQNCSKLSTITIKTTRLTEKSVKTNAFKGIYKKATFKCPKNLLDAYKKLLIKRGAPKTCKFK